MYALQSHERDGSLIFQKKKFISFIYFYLCWVFVAMLGLSLVVVHKLLLAAASLVVDHGLYGARASVAVVPGLSCSVV